MNLVRKQKNEHAKAQDAIFLSVHYQYAFEENEVKAKSTEDHWPDVPPRSGGGLQSSYCPSHIVHRRRPFHPRTQ
jgi:hypothetical protein